jgi:transposase-like protein
MEEFADSRNALRARFQAERKYRSYPDVEVVVLGAESEAAAAMKTISARLGMTAETLRQWVKQAEVDSGQPPGRTSDSAAGTEDVG